MAFASYSIAPNAGFPKVVFQPELCRLFSEARNRNYARLSLKQYGLPENAVKITVNNNELAAVCSDNRRILIRANVPLMNASFPIQTDWKTGERFVMLPLSKEQQARVEARRERVERRDEEKLKKPLTVLFSAKGASKKIREEAKQNPQKAILEIIEEKIKIAQKAGCEFYIARATEAERAENLDLRANSLVIYAIKGDYKGAVGCINPTYNSGGKVREDQKILYEGLKTLERRLEKSGPFKVNIEEWAGSARHKGGKGSNNAVKAGQPNTTRNLVLTIDEKAPPTVYKPPIEKVIKPIKTREQEVL